MAGPTTGADGIPSPAQRAAELTKLGGFAVWQVHTVGLLTLTTALDADHLAARFAATRSGLARGTGLPAAKVPPRTAVSAAQIGLVSRLWSVALASVALHDWVPALTLPQVLVDRSHRNPSPLALRDPGSGRAVSGLEETVAAMEDLVVHGAVAAVTDACGKHGHTSGRVLVSNAASSLVSAARVVGGQVPGRAPFLDAVARTLLQLPWLAAGGGYPCGTAESERRRPDFRRTGCCLYYRLPGHGLCPDCILVRPGRPGDEHH